RQVACEYAPAGYAGDLVLDQRQQRLNTAAALVPGLHDHAGNARVESGIAADHEGRIGLGVGAIDRVELLAVDVGVVEVRVLRTFADGEDHALVLRRRELCAAAGIEEPDQDQDRNREYIGHGPVIEG